MNKIKMLARQTADAYEWIDKLIDPVPHEKWDQTPEVLESNVTWQVGHLIVSIYYHSIMTIVGHQTDILQAIPMKKYSGLFTDAPPEYAMGKTDPKKLKNYLGMMREKSIEVITSLNEEDLDSNLEPARMPHPVAKNKFEALDWNIKHTMWHCGQIGILKRIVHERFDFGMKKS